MAKKKEPVPVETPEQAEDIRFSKTQILKMKRYENRVDLLGVLLDDKTSYSHAEVESVIQNFMKEEVE